jgi:hypothetical protein
MAVADAPRSPLGYVSDFGGWNLTFTEPLETVQDLSWPESVRTYAKMSTDPQLTAVLSAYTLPIRQAPWAVDPAGCEDEVVQLIADDLGLPILGMDEAPGAARRRGVNFGEHLRLALDFLVYGHMPFEMLFEIRDGRARLKELSERLPETITQMFTRRDGSLQSITQFGDTNEIPGDHLLWYAHNRRGAAWAGKSILRSAYGSWLLKHETWRVHATAIRRFGMGIPQVETPPGATPAQVAEATRLASAIRVGDQAGVGLPNGFKLSLAGMQGSVPDAVAFMKYLDQQMSRMALAQALDLGATDVGSKSLGETFIDLLLTSLNAIAGEMADTLTGLSVKMVDFNFGEDEPAPRIVCGDVGSRPIATAQAIAQLVQVGAITPDTELENWVRERWTLPDIAPGFKKKPVPTAPPAPVRTAPTPQPQAAPTPTSGGTSTPTNTSVSTSADSGSGSSTPQSQTPAAQGAGREA